MKLAEGAPLGEVFPPAPEIPPLSVDARTHVLERFADYLHCIEFQVPDPPGVKPYQIPRERILVEWPDDDQTPMKWPTIAFEPGHYEFLPKGLTPATDEASRDVHGRGTVLVSSYEYRELVTLVIWASTRAQRRTMLAGIEWALTPTEQFAGIRLRVPDYYNQTVHFEALEGQNIDVEDSMRRRRRTEMILEMRFDVVRLVRMDEILPSAEVAVFEQSDPAYDDLVRMFPHMFGAPRRR